MDDQFLNPLHQIKKAKPSENLYGKIEAMLFDNKIIPIQTIVLVAASILLLLFVNIYTVKNSNVSITESTNIYTDQFINDFQIY